MVTRRTKAVPAFGVAVRIEPRTRWVPVKQLAPRCLQTRSSAVKRGRGGCARSDARELFGAADRDAEGWVLSAVARDHQPNKIARTTVTV